MTSLSRSISWMDHPHGVMAEPALAYRSCVRSWKHMVRCWKYNPPRGVVQHLNSHCSRCQSQNNDMDISMLAYLSELLQTTLQSGQVRPTLEQFLIALRKGFVFDNVAVYLQDEKSSTLDIVYARAVGRAKTAEADADWGETFASQVLRKGKLLMQDPLPGASPDDRLQQAYLVGLPIVVDSMTAGALVFVRFGGPPYEDDHIKTAIFASNLLSILF